MASVNDEPNEGTQVLTLDEYFMLKAKLCAERSKDPVTQVGAVIVEPRKRYVLSDGYNGMPRGCAHMPWEKKNVDPLEQKSFYVCHAEMNAIINARRELDDCIIYTTLFPCADCAKYMIQAGIKKVIYLEDKKEKPEMEGAKRLFDHANVEYDLFQTDRHVRVVLNLKTSK